MIRLETQKGKEMQKTISIFAGTMSLKITGAPVEIALPEIEAIKDVSIISVENGRIYATLYVKGDAALMARAKELIANGWAWQ